MALFVDGEPLDISKLNAMASNIDDLKAQLAIMTNAYNAANKNRSPQVPIIQMNQQAITNSVAGTITVDLEGYVPGIYLAGETPRIVASPRSTLQKGQYVNISIINITKDNPKVMVTSNQKLSNFLIDWIAVYMRPITY